MKKLLTAMALVGIALSAHAALDFIEIPTGATVTAPCACKVLSARALSTVASGTATAKALRSIEVMGVATNVAAATNFTYTVVATNYEAGALVLRERGDTFIARPRAATSR